MLIYLNDEDLSHEIKNGKVLIDFYADWCGPCRMISPLLEELNSADNSIKIIKINIDKHEDIAKKYNVMSIPMLMLFENGNKIKENVGFLNKDELNQFIKNND